MTERAGPRGSAQAAKVARPVTRDYLERAAVFYLERYASSSDNLRRVLIRKARRRLVPDAAGDIPLTPEALAALIDDVVARVMRTGLVDDARYAEMKVHSLMRRGTSTRAIRTKLMGKGVPAASVSTALAEHAPDDLALARRFAQRKRIGPWRQGDPSAFRAKDMAALGRAGFSYGIARTVMDGEGDGSDV